MWAGQFSICFRKTSFWDITPREQLKSHFGTDTCETVGSSAKKSSLLHYVQDEMPLLGLRFSEYWGIVPTLVILEVDEPSLVSA